MLFTQEKSAPVSANIAANARIIAAYAGTGKTTLAKLYPDKVVDFVCMPYKYYLTELDGNFDESCKANHDNEMQANWPHNYVAAIKEASHERKIIVIPSDFRVLELLRKENISYILCYPQREAKKVYRSRFVNRGNTECFMDIFIGGWDWFMDSLERDAFGQHIVLNPYQYLSDVIDV